MSKVNLSFAQYENYGRCAVIANRFVEICVTLDVGPRIIKMNLIGKKNLMCNDLERKADQDVSSVFGAGKRWYIYGGHRLWVAPEHMPKTYYPDNDPVDFREENGRFIFTPPVQAVTNFQNTLEIEMSADKPEFTVLHRVRNTGDSAVTAAVWALSVMAAGGLVVCPQPDEDTGLLSNRNLIIWPFTKMTDPRVKWLDDYILVQQNPEISRRFKIGINQTKGWLAYINHGQAVKKTIKPNHPAGTYPDFGCSAEIFTNDQIIEAETLGELRTLGAGEAMEHTEFFTLREAPEVKIGDFCADCQEKLADYVKEHLQ